MAQLSESALDRCHHHSTVATHIREGHLLAAARAAFVACRPVGSSFVADSLAAVIGLNRLLAAAVVSSSSQYYTRRLDHWRYCTFNARSLFAGRPAEFRKGIAMFSKVLAKHEVVVVQESHFDARTQSTRMQELLRRTRCHVFCCGTSRRAKGILVFFSDYAFSLSDAVHMSVLEEGAIVHLTLLSPTGSMSLVGAHRSSF